MTIGRTDYCHCCPGADIQLGRMRHRLDVTVRFQRGDGHSQKVVTRDLVNDMILRKAKGIKGGSMNQSSTRMCRGTQWSWLCWRYSRRAPWVSEAESEGEGNRQFQRGIGARSGRWTLQPIGAVLSHPSLTWYVLL